VLNALSALAQAAVLDGISVRLAQGYDIGLAAV
jgi:hypothetical protein